MTMQNKQFNENTSTATGSKRGFNKPSAQDLKDLAEANFQRDVNDARLEIKNPTDYMRVRIGADAHTAINKKYGI